MKMVVGLLGGGHSGLVLALVAAQAAAGGIDLNATAGLLIQIPLVLAFMIFTLKLTERHDTTVERIVEKQQQTYLTIHERFEVTINEQHGRWREVRQDQVLAIRTMAQQLEYLTNITLLVYGSINNNPQDIEKKMREWSEMDRRRE